ncbi:MAG TPA: universal stress protein [Longimicrobiales bacterium]
MYHRILVPLDGTRFGDHALPYAIWIASRTGAAVELVHVHRRQEVDAGLDALPVYHFEHVEEADARRDREALRAEIELLEERAADIELRFGVRTSTRVLHGARAHALEQEAHDFVADLVVMATHARRGVSRLVYGDLAHQLLHDFNVPMLAVHPTAADAPLASGELTHFMVSLDGSGFSEQILDVVGPLATQLEARLSLMHVYSNRTLRTNGLHAEEHTIPHRTEAFHYLNDLAERMASRLPDPKLMIVDSDDPSRAIVEALAGSPEAALAMATHGRSGLSRMILGSVADNVVHATHHPVLLYRPRLASLPYGDLASALRVEDR